MRHLIRSMGILEWTVVILYFSCIFVLFCREGYRKEECDFILKNNQECKRLYKAIMYDGKVSDDELQLMRLYAIGKD